MIEEDEMMIFDRIFNRKYIWLIALLAVVSIFSVSCKKSGGADDVSMYDLYQALCNGETTKDLFSDMKYASSSDQNPADVFSNISDMDYDKVTDFFVCYAADGNGNADEVAAIEVKNAADLSDAETSLQAHLDYRKSLYKTYDASQVKKLDDAKIVTHGRVAVLIVSEDPAAVSAAFEEFF